MYEIREDANPDNIKTTRRIYLTESFLIQKRLPSRITNYAVKSINSDFYEQLAASQFEQYNASSERRSIDVVPFLIRPIQNNSDTNQKMIKHFHLE